MLIVDTVYPAAQIAGGINAPPYINHVLVRKLYIKLKIAVDYASLTLPAAKATIPNAPAT